MVGTRWDNSRDRLIYHNQPLVHLDALIGILLRCVIGGVDIGTLAPFREAAGRFDRA